MDVRVGPKRRLKWSRSVVSDSLRPCGLCPWDFPGKSTGVGCHFLLQGSLPSEPPGKSRRKLSTEESMLLNCGVGEDSWEPLGLQGDQTSQSWILTGNQSWIFTGSTDGEAEAPVFWPPDAKNWLIGKDPDAGKDWRWEEKGTIEDEMVGWHPWLDGHEFEQAPGVGEGQESLACSSPCGCKESDTTEQMNWSELKMA